MYRPRPKPFDKVKVGSLMTILGGIFGALMGLFNYVIYTRGGSVPRGLDYIQYVLAIMGIIGGIISFVGGLVAKSQGINNSPRIGGILAIIGSVVGGINVITLIGGIFLIKGNQLVKPQTTPWEVPIEEEARWKSPGLKRCPICSAQMPMDAKFCPNCGEPFGG